MWIASVSCLIHFLWLWIDCIVDHDSLFGPTMKIRFFSRTLKFKIIIVLVISLVKMTERVWRSAICRYSKIIFSYSVKEKTLIILLNPVSPSHNAYIVVIFFTINTKFFSKLCIIVFKKLTLNVFKLTFTFYF